MLCNFAISLEMKNKCNYFYYYDADIIVSWRLRIDWKKWHSLELEGQATK